MSDETADGDRAFTRGLFSHPDPDEATPAEATADRGNHVPLEGSSPSPTPQDDHREFARSLFTD